MGQHMKMVTEE